MTQKNKIIRFSKFSILLVVAISAVFGLFLLQTSEGQSETLSAPNENFEVNIPQSADAYQSIRKFYVYDDWGSELNHYYPTGWMGDTNHVTMNESYTDEKYTGYSSIQTVYAPTGIGQKWAGVYWLHPENNWGFWPLGYDISGAISLRFWVKGETGGEVLEFFGGGIGEPYPDTLTKASTYTITLSSTWEEYVIDLEGEDLSRVAGGFGWATSWDSNPGGATFYLDDIHYEIAVTPGVEIAPGVFTMRPDELILSGDYSKKSEISATSPLVLNQSVPGSVLLGYDSVLDSRNGGSLEINITLENIPTMAELKIMWDSDLHPGLISPVAGTTANITIDGTEIWNGICNIPNGSDYIANINSPLRILFQPNSSNFVLRLNVDSNTVWHISRITLSPEVDDTTLLNNAGFAYGPFRQGQTPDLEIYPKREEIWDDLSIMSIFTASVKTYTIDDTMEDFARLGHLFGLNTLAGIWIADNNTANLEQVNRAISIADQTEGIIVGNEVLLNGYLSVSELITWIDMVANNVTVNVTYSDTKEIWVNNATLATHVDFILANLHPVWAYQPIETAIDFTISAFEELETTFPGLDIFVGETGWPSDGIEECTIANQSRYLIDWINAVKNGELKGYFFEFFDEPWKLAMPIEPHWGIFYANRLPKDSASIYADYLLSISLDSPALFKNASDRTLPYAYDNTILSWNIYDKSNYSVDIFLDGVNMSTGEEFNGYKTYDFIFPSGLAPGSHNVRLNVTNILGDSIEHIVTIICETQNPPTIRHIVLAIDGSTGDLVLNYDFEDPEGDPDLSTIRWYRNDTLMDAYNDMMRVPVSDLNGHDEWYVVITPYDGIDESDQLTSPTVTIPPQEETRKILGFPIYALLGVTVISALVLIKKYKK